jgi:hypothetical protein
MAGLILFRDPAGCAGGCRDVTSATFGGHGPIHERHGYPVAPPITARPDAVWAAFDSQPPRRTFVAVPKGSRRLYRYLDGMSN